LPSSEFVIADRGDRQPSSTAIRWWAHRETSPTENGLAPIRSPAATKIVFLVALAQLHDQRRHVFGAARRTVIFLVLSSGSAILIPPGGGRRLPWKSLIARIRRSIGAQPARPRPGQSQHQKQRAREGWQERRSHDSIIEHPA